MPADRNLVPKSDHRYFRNFDKWRDKNHPFCNVLRESIPTEQLTANARRYKKVMTKSLADISAAPDLTKHWNQRAAYLAGRISTASLYHLFTGDTSVLKFAIRDLNHLLKCPERYFSHTACKSHQWIDLETGHVLEGLALMELSFGEAIPSKTRQRLADAAINRGLLEGLDGLRERKFIWTTRIMNWRTVMCGSLALAGMAFLPNKDEAYELIEYTIEGALALMATGDRAGAWNEGPGYWEYGIGHLAKSALFLQTLSNGKVDLFKHSFLQRTGDFRQAFTVQPGQIWNWSDCQKGMPSSTLLALLARVYDRGDYQDLLMQEGINNLWQIYYLDQSIKREPAQGDTTSYFPDVGMITMRSGDGKDGSYVGVKGGIAGRGIGHQHMDMGSLVVFTNGQELLSELDHWQYAEGEGKAGGFFDRTCRRWDYDYCGSIGHNVATVSGQYRKWTYEGYAKVTHVPMSRKMSGALIDTTQIYDEPITRARRAVITLFPDITVVIDDVTAKVPVRLQTLYHYIAKAKTTEETFTISKGSADLHGVSLAPCMNDNIIIGQDSRTAYYHATEKPTTHQNKYLYIQNLHRSKRLTFVCGLQYGKRPLPAAKWIYKNTGPGTGIVTVMRNGRKQAFEFDMVKKKLTAR